MQTAENSGQDTGGETHGETDGETDGDETGGEAVGGRADEGGTDGGETYGGTGGETGGETGGGGTTGGETDGGGTDGGETDRSVEKAHANKSFAQVRSAIAAYSPSLRDTFDSFDLNSDGSLSRVEFKHALVEIGIDLDELAFDQLFLEMDRDEDLEVNFQDFQSFMTLTPPGGAGTLGATALGSGFLSGGAKFFL